MAEKPKPEPDDKEQSARFIEDAKKLNVSESKEDFDKSLSILIPPQKTSDIGHGHS